MAVTAHFIDNSWKLQSRLLRFLYVEAPHTKEVLSSALCSCIYDWNLDCRLSTITLDNCSTNDAVMSIMEEKLPQSSLILKGKFLHMRCCAHILNLIVQDGLSIIADGIERVRDSVVYWTASVFKVQKFEKSARTYVPDCTKKLVLDCKTRWNSTYEMLRVALMYKDIFEILKSRESSTYRCAPTKEDWERAAKICDKLAVFNDITHEFSASKHPTANIYFLNICEIKIALECWIKCTDSLIVDMAKTMHEKYNKYWGEVNLLLAVAAVLDPRYKLSLVEYYYKEIYEDYLFEFEVEKVKDLVKDLVNEYSTTCHRRQVGGNSNVMSPHSEHAIGKSKLGGFARYLESQNRPSEKSELEKYLGDGFVPLQRIAKDILSIPVTSVASESAFSTGGRVLSVHRSRLLPATVEALMCAQNWIWTNIKGGDLLEEVSYQQILEKLEVEEEEEACVTDDAGQT